MRKALGSDTLTELAVAREAEKAALGAPTAADKADLTVDELQELAREQETPGRSSMDRPELVAPVAPRWRPAPSRRLRAEGVSGAASTGRGRMS